VREKLKEDKRRERKRKYRYKQLDYLVFMYTRAPVPFDSWHMVKRKARS
jgi:hypothetical protein